jgi:hypothetical protein
VEGELARGASDHDGMGAGLLANATPPPPLLRPPPPDGTKSVSRNNLGIEAGSVSLACFLR